MGQLSPCRYVCSAPVSMGGQRPGSEGTTKFDSEANFVLLRSGSYSLVPNMYPNTFSNRILLSQCSSQLQIRNLRSISIRLFSHSSNYQSKLIDASVIKLTQNYWIHWWFRIVQGYLTKLCMGAVRRIAYSSSFF
jgi:hypothetical protein